MELPIWQHYKRRQLHFKREPNASLTSKEEQDLKQQKQICSLCSSTVRCFLFQSLKKKKKKKPNTLDCKVLFDQKKQKYTLTENLECSHFKSGLFLPETNRKWVGKAPKFWSKEERLLTLGFWQTCCRNKHYWEWYGSIVSLLQTHAQSRARIDTSGARAFQ